MRVILLGHRGLLGSAFASYLIRQADVELIRVDSSTYRDVRGIRSDVVINANGSSNRPLATADPLASFRLNDEATLASLIDLPTELYIHISTIGVYLDPRDISANVESAPLDPLRMSNYGRFKWIAELLVRAHAKKWVIARVGPVVGPGLRKNSVYDLLAKRTLFFSPESELPYVDTRDVARIVWSLRQVPNEIVNVAGAGYVKLSELAIKLGVDLSPSLWDLPRDDWAVDISKLMGHTTVPRSWDTVERFTQEWVESYTSRPGPK